MPPGTNRQIAHFHADVDGRLEFDIKNYNSGSTASTNLFLITDSGTPQSKYMRLGLNSSTYAAGDIVDGPEDAFLVVTGSNLFIGNIGAGKTLTFFNGAGNTAAENARLYVAEGGSVGINTNELTVGNFESLFVRGLTGSINIATFRTNLDNYGQINVQNESTGITASSDIVATADNGNEEQYYINMGINNSTFTGSIGDPNDAYLYSTGNHLHIGNTTPGQEIMFFVGTDDVEAGKKFTLRDTNLHDMTGSLDVSGSVTSSFKGDLDGTAATASLALKVRILSGSTGDGLASYTGSFTGSVLSDHLVIPTSAPITPRTGSLYFDNNFIYVYTGTQYKSASLS
jgi:hypothetical protein